MAYKMKGFSGFKSSPVKVSDSAVVDAQDKLDKVELGYRTPGWATALGKVFGGGKSTEKEKENNSEEKKEKETIKVKTDRTIEGIDERKNKLKRNDLTAGGLK